MIVMKFGGTSVQDASCIERVAEIIKQHLHRRPVVVVSAMGKTTRNLLRAAELASERRLPDSLNLISDIENYHIAEARKVVNNFERTKAYRAISSYFGEMRDLVKGLSILRESTPRSKDAITAYGELISSAILATSLIERGVGAVLLDSRNFIITDENFTRAAPIFDLTNERICAHLLPELAAGRVPVIQGYIGATRTGATTTLGFEGSDYTAAIVGAAIGAEDIQIWKDVYGLMSADPAIISDARTVKMASFDEVAELTYFGAKVLHPSAIWPAAQKGIPVHIYNSKHPQAVGTLITDSTPKSNNLVKSITYKRGITLINAISNRQQSASEFLKAVFDILDHHRIAPDLIVTSEVRIAFAVSGEADLERLIADMRRLGQVQVRAGKASLCLVGQIIKQTADIASTIFSAIRDVRVDLISQGASPNSLIFITGEGDLEATLMRLHESFFAEADADLFGRLDSETVNLK